MALLQPLLTKRGVTVGATVGALWVFALIEALVLTIISSHMSLFNQPENLRMLLWLNLKGFVKEMFNRQNEKHATVMTMITLSCSQNGPDERSIPGNTVAVQAVYSIYIQPLGSGNQLETSSNSISDDTEIDRERVERIEARLKEDILKESERYGGDIMVKVVKLDQQP
ncbi:hypothetical protein CTI12_AA234610 [Artemisia annua]|uniref:Uncharacterized protein n=1 Tax=Artemisia annua TaxID=35608 RepID=A0A2U1NQ51_ARTAN|nr:hypothetical protein CTI12_AA234610 [Artemisia annua]